jgi:hypothetical protein
MDVIYPRYAGIDVHKKTVRVCLLIRQEYGKPSKEFSTYSTTTADLLNLLDWLLAQGCTHVALEGTGVYWKPIYNLFEGQIQLLAVNAQHTKTVPGRKTDTKDAEWQGKGYWVVGYASGGELIGQSGLHLHQGILVVGQLLQFLDQLAIGVETTQVGEIGSSRLSQQIDINGIGLDSRWSMVPIYGAWVDRIHRPVMVQQGGKEQAMCCFDDAGDVLSASLAHHAFQVTIQLVQTLGSMGKTDGFHLAAVLINGQRIVIG